MTQAPWKKGQTVLYKTKDTSMLRPGNILIDTYLSYMQTYMFTQSIVQEYT